MSEQPVPLDLVTVRRFGRALKDFMTSEVRWRACGVFALLIAFALTLNGLNVVNSYVGRDFITAISHRDRTGFIRQAILYVGVFAGSTVVAVLPDSLRSASGSSGGCGSRDGSYYDISRTAHIFISRSQPQSKTPISASPTTFVRSRPPPCRSR